MQFISREDRGNGGFFEHYQFDESDSVYITDGTHFAIHVFMGRDDEGLRPKPLGWVVTHPGGETCRLGKSTVMGDVIECVTSYGTDRHPTTRCTDPAKGGN